MKFEVIVTIPFEKQAKPLLKKYKSLKADIAAIVKSLSEVPSQGTPIGSGCCKVRLKITSKGKGKSGGGRIITYVINQKKKILLTRSYKLSSIG